MKSGLMVAQIDKRFGGVHVLKDVAFEVQPGQVHSLIGPNGAGKSTLANIVSGYVVPDGGTVQIDGHDLSGMRPDRRARAGLGRTFQNLELFTGMTVMENVLTGRYLRTDRSVVLGLLSLPRERRILRADEQLVRRLLAEVGLEDSPSREVDTLAFGQAKLLEFARLIAMEPRVVVMDEPAAGLPSNSARAIGQRIRALADSGIAVMLIEHNMGLVMSISDEITVLDHGVLLAHGAPRDIKDNPDVVEAYLGPDDDSFGRNGTEARGTC